MHVCSSSRGRYLLAFWRLGRASADWCVLLLLHALWVRDLVGRKPDRVESRGGVVGRGVVAAYPVAACFTWAAGWTTSGHASRSFLRASVILWHDCAEGRWVRSQECTDVDVREPLLLPTRLVLLARTQAPLPPRSLTLTERAAHRGTCCAVGPIRTAQAKHDTSAEAHRNALRRRRGITTRPTTRRAARVGSGSRIPNERG